MENAVEATTIIFNVMGGLGLFFTGVGVLWYVTVYKEKKEYVFFCPVILVVSRGK